VPFSPEYIRLVLNQNFEDAKARLLAPLMAIHYAHLVMLVETKIVTAGDGRTLRGALDGLDLNAIRDTSYDGQDEDLFFHVDRLIAGACGADLAGRLHTARSRNDMDMTMYRMRLRESVLSLAEATLVLRHTLLDTASAHRATVYPAHTHTQPAQPTTLAHYLLAVVEQLERDTERLFAAYETTNHNPLGACAITGTGFPIDRARTAELLGFAGPTGNTYGSIATVDYLLESAGAAATLITGLGRVVQDLLLWCTQEFGYVRLDDSLVQTSSIMPQKRNPVALEHARALASKALAQLAGLPMVVHNTPFGDIVDTEDDLQPLVATAFGDAARAVALVAAAVAGATFDTARMRARASVAGVAMTELADRLVRDHGLSFKAAHAIAARVATDDHVTGARVTAVARELGHHLSVSEAMVAEALNPDQFVAVRRTPGGPAPEITASAIEQSRGRLAADEAEAERARGALSAADHRLRRALDAAVGPSAG